MEGTCLLLHLLVRLILRFARFLFRLLRLLLTKLLVLRQLLLADILIVLGGGLSVLDVFAPLRLGLLVFWSDIIGSSLKEVRYDLQYGADKSEDESRETFAAAVVAGCLLVLIWKSSQYPYSMKLVIATYHSRC